MAEAEVECSLCLSVCSQICYQRHKDWYACHNRECALHYPENIDIDGDGRFVLGEGGGSYQPRQEDESVRGEYRRPRLRDALRSLLCGLSRSRSTSPDWGSYTPPRRNQRSWSPNQGPAPGHNTPSSRHNTPPPQHDGPSSRPNTPTPRNNRASPRNTGASPRNTRASRPARQPTQENNESDDEIRTHTSSIDLPPLTRQENGRRRVYRDTSGSTRYTIVLEREGDAPMNLRSIMRDGEPL